MAYVEVTIQVLDEMKDVVQAELLDQGFEGVWDKGNELSAYIDQDQFNHKAIYDHLARHGMENHFTYQVLEDQNWNSTWEAGFDPVEIDGRVSIRSPFHKANSNVDHEVVIQPQMSFGTGHHETTELMVLAMLEIDFKDKTVLDMGTGTGVLAVLSSLLGASEVLGIDNELNSYQNASENLKYNDVSNVQYLHGSAETIPDREFDIVLSNITKNINLRLLPELVQRVCKGGILVLSGFMNFDLEEVNNAVKAHGFQTAQNIHKGDWECLVFTK